jgi:hypothetical protein
MKIMFDSLSTQVLYQQKPIVPPPNPGDYPDPTHKRINTLLGAIKGAGLSSEDPWHISYSNYPITTLQRDPVTKKNVPPSSPYFSILVPFGTGNVIVVGNSGMFADYGTPKPSCGMAPIQNNLLFLLNCLGYLGGKRSSPRPGYCPSNPK